MGLGLEFGALHVQVDFLIPKLEGAPLDSRRAPHKGFELHAHDLGVEMNALSLVSGGQHEVIQVVDHGLGLLKWTRKGRSCVA